MPKFKEKTLVVAVDYVAVANLKFPKTMLRRLSPIAFEVDLHSISIHEKRLMKLTNFWVSC